MNSKLLLTYIFTTILIVLTVSIQAYITQRADTVFIGLLYPANFFLAWYFGLGPALYSIFLSTVLCSFLLFKPYYSFTAISLIECFRLGVFALTSIIACWLINKGKRFGEANVSYATRLSDLENRFQRSIGAIDLGVWYCDLPFDVLTWDTQTKKHFWLPADAHVTIGTFYERIHPEDREKTRLAIEASIQKKAPYDIVYRTTNPANPTEVKYIRALGWTDFDSEGNPIRFDGVTFDNTVEETIYSVGSTISAELDQGKLVQQVTDAATQLSKAQFGAFFYNLINEKGESYTLYTVSGVPIEKFSSFPMPRNTEVFAPTFSGEGIVRSDNITKDPRYGKNDPYYGKPKGHLPVTSYLAVPVRSRTGEVIGGLFLGHEKEAVFSEREERIVSGLASQIGIAMDNARLYEQAKESIRLRDEFLSISSHELKTPLTSLKLQLQSFSRQMSKTSDQEFSREKFVKMAESSERQVNRLNSLIDNLLDVSRITHGKLRLNYEQTDLPVLIHELAERFKPVFTENKTHLNIHVPDSLIAQVDRIRFEQVLVNLVTNSIKYAHGSEVEIHLAKVGTEVHLRVKDHGPGISEEDQKRIFKRFERVEGTGNGGLGLGLYIVNQIVTAHKGSIKLDSKLGHGAIFEIILPAEPR